VRRSSGRPDLRFLTSDTGREHRDGIALTASDCRTYCVCGAVPGGFCGTAGGGGGGGAGIAGVGAWIHESHHSAKKDAPSGTAIALQRVIEGAGGKPVDVASTRAGHIPGDAQLVRLLILGAVNWAGTWYRLGGRLSLDKVAEDAARLFLSGSR